MACDFECGDDDLDSERRATALYLQRRVCCAADSLNGATNSSRRSGEVVAADTMRVVVAAERGVDDVQRDGRGRHGAGVGAGA
eukprot:3417993-Pleurochrysis_carterae.AAC.1